MTSAVGLSRLREALAQSLHHSLLMTTLEDHRAAFLPIAEALCRALRAEVEKLGLAAGDVALPAAEAAVYRLTPDPAAGRDSLIGEWLDARGQRTGMLVLNADGSFFAEHDVVRLHPGDPGCFVEAVSAWGRDERIMSEPRLMRMPAD
jgi:hypothetical protein